MAVPAIQGMLKKHLLTHLSIGIAGGAVSGYAWWSVSKL
ncbi:BQ2448_7219 [Microbotryum intermedium]|uniref:BQ2448_7219 protein n=1 Tax=Microbotryum intermedium TaxID=269621 RepID=A0A238FMQ6_9BASI|nr:BQ2448_7219 [Microbotryum intermedium]